MRTRGIRVRREMKRASFHIIVLLSIAFQTGVASATSVKVEIKGIKHGFKENVELSLF